MIRSGRTAASVGARSDIGTALVKVAAAAGCPLALAARDALRLHDVGKLLSREHGIEVSMLEFDVLATDTHEAFLERLPFLPVVAVCPAGLLGVTERRFAEADIILRNNLLGPISILGAVASRMEKRGHSAIVGISSVAGDRGCAEKHV